ncbi:ABC transporter ATP-binding protein [Chlamydiales bacterium]|nr:ABC transporter ATP-binding protein [Chlamydiales bacterium]
MNPLLEAKKIQKSFAHPKKITLFNEINLSVYPGESVAIMGKSGQGKTTLLQILGTLEEPSEGSLSISGKEVTRFNRSKIRNQDIGFIFQAFHLLDDYTVLENVTMPARIDRKIKYKEACALLEKVGMTDHMHHEAKLLSGGEKQRICLARALCNNPNLILADEPSGNLDTENAEMVHSFLLQLAKDEGKGLLIVTHDPKLAARCDRMLTLNNGRLI